jgi:outer membrane protein OmpA-like peptidoglycan-associated protein
VFSSTVAVGSGNGDYHSGAFAPTAAGSYHWTASYSGDSDNAAAASACGAPLTVSAATPRLLLDAPALVIASRTFHATCRASAGTLRSCSVEVHLSGAGVTRTRPLAVGSATSTAGARSLTVRLRLTLAGHRALARALGGVRVTLDARGDRGESRALRTQRPLRLLARTHHVEPPGAMFGPNTATLTRAGRRFLAGVGARARNVGSIRCTGHTASIPEGAGGDALSLVRAHVACRFLHHVGLHARYTTVGLCNRHPRASNHTEPGRARNRYVALTITHQR